MSYPKVADISISEERAEKMRKIIVNGIQNSLIRNIFKMRKIDESKNTENRNIIFSKVGINHIVDKIWFVDNPPGNTYYDSEGLIRDYSDSLKEYEEIFVWKYLRDKNIIQEKNELTEKNLEEAIKMHIGKGLKVDSIIINNDEKMYESKNFKIKRFGESKKLIIGYYKDIPVFVSRFLKHGENIIVDKDSFGEFLIKKDVSVNLSEIGDDEREDIQQKTKIPNDKLDEYIKFQINETIYFKIINSKAVTLI